MATFKMTISAIEDLSNIWNYTIEHWSEPQADKYYKLITNTCAELAKFPHLGKDYNEIHPQLKGYIISKHIIFYRITFKKEITITRILHESMDLKNKMT